MPTRAGCTLPHLFMLVVTTFALAGCAGSALVEKDNLETLEKGQSEQTREIQQLSEDLKAHHRGMVRNSNENTRALIETIRQQISPPSCPERPQPVCREVSEPASKSAPSQRLNGMLIVGELERVHFMEPGLTYEARVDSGAETSSLDARNVTYFERNGEDWVRFDVPVPGAKNELETLERPLSRNARIIQASADDSERRAVVEMQFAIGDHVQKAEFTLSNRENLSQTVLVGRNILRDVMLIDVGKEYATSLPEKLKSSKPAAKAGKGDGQ
ncbi:ATP-dependent zinc protease [Marinobacter nanhaiticus D15-8W]|uniref:ATP-dependent zinc protease n=1 Tax=Marinobacter nanhaiticus D15-8W TaxID=626887 RepID=N6X758_9GAMM|nr:RimK/LysX family protein [Marinobacter nanhaiticus]ENO16973.1 ATP-dependent zinc protease [Marinobacter nanhaiticus D15-8W]BES72031.1 ATP-dependent zinc protease [Marinobacter nanhaiticus D15-8W]